jgi:hypothetical protein
MRDGDESREKGTSTLEVIAAAAEKGHEVIVAGEVADIRFPKGGSLSLRASKLFVQLLERAGADVVQDREHRTTLESLNWSHKELESIEDAVDELHGTRVSLSVETPRGRRLLSGSILAHVDRPAEGYAGELLWEFSKTFRAVVKRSHHWAAISARAVLAMECKYSPWLYQLCALHAGRDRVSHEWELDDLRERLGASAPSLRRWIAFRQRVLEPAVAEINHLTGIGIAWEPIKRGRSVVGIRLFTWRKAQGELDAAAAELAQPRIGRKARRDDLVEQIVDRQTRLRRRIAEEFQALPLHRRR